MASVFIWLFIICSTRSQGTFQNLAFESSVLPLSPVNPSNPLVPFTNALPGWAGFIGTNQVADALYNSLNLDLSTIALLTNNFTTGPSFAPLIAGNFTAVLQAQREPNDINKLAQVSLAQSGMVPTGSLSIRFLAYTAGTPFTVTLEGVNIPIVDLETFPNYRLYGGDISAFAGSIAELRFTAFPDNYPHSTVFALDSIQFSTEPVPEPSVSGLCALGALLLGWRLHRMRKLGDSTLNSGLRITGCVDGKKFCKFVQGILEEGTNCKRIGRSFHSEANNVMKQNSKLVIRLTAVFVAVSVCAQGTFQNLDFESPLGPLNGTGSPLTVPFTNALTGWVGYLGTNQATRVRIDGVNLDNATHAILRSNFLNVPLIEGGYTAILQAGRDPNEFPIPTTLVSVALAQTGLVPVDSLSLRFLAYTAGTPFTLTLGGVNIPVVDLATFPSYHLYGGDISAFAGSIAELRFTAFPDNYPHSTVFALDSIQFSNQPIPEPSVFGLFVLGALLVGWRWRRKRTP